MIIIRRWCCCCRDQGMQQCTSQALPPVASLHRHHSLSAARCLKELTHSTPMQPPHRGGIRRGSFQAAASCFRAVLSKWFPACILWMRRVRQDAWQHVPQPVTATCRAGACVCSTRCHGAVSDSEASGPPWQRRCRCRLACSLIPTSGPESVGSGSTRCWCRCCWG